MGGEEIKTTQTKETPKPSNIPTIPELEDLLSKIIDSNGRTIEIRFGNFESQEGRETVERAVVEHAKKNTPDLLYIWRMLGDEDNPLLVEELEKKYDVKLENLSIAAYLFGLTYDFWSIFSADPDTNTGQEKIKNKLSSIVEKARKLATYEVNATHQTGSSGSFDEIRKTKVLKASDSTDYEGAGVYVGILGGYRDWGTDTIELRLSLANTLPIITDKQYPQAMAVVLSKELDLGGGAHEIATTRGPIKWRNDEYYNDNPIDDVTNWKLDQIKEILQCNAFTFFDSQSNTNFFVIETNEPPIVWACLAKALKISDAIPLATFLELYPEAGE